MTYFMVDVEADGPHPGTYSMIEVGAVRIEHKLSTTFYGQLHPITDNYLDEALDVVGYSREETMQFDDPEQVMSAFRNWVVDHTTDSRPIFMADNVGFDWQFVNWYFHHFLGDNPFGHSGEDLGSLFKGAERTMFENFKHLRETEHTHNPVDDAMGNAEALLTIIDDYDIDFPLPDG